MGSYFKPWRRKIGALLLMMACVFLAGWGRSKNFTDQLNYSTSTTSCQIIFLLDGHLGWIIFQDIQPKHMPNFGYDSTQPFTTFDEVYDDKWKTWNWRFCGFYVGFRYVEPDVQYGKMTIFLLSFWSIVVPLTLLSAWLLLSKPRSSISNEFHNT